jgi:four helix bundle protein
MHTFSFEKLIVWQEARFLAKDIYILTKSFPDDEKYGMINQVRRAAISVSSNIAEGGSRATKKDQSYFYNIAYSSLMELLSQLIIAADLQYCQELKINNDFRPRIEKVSNLLNALRNAALKPRSS